ncbi:MAG TPA: DUF2252 domain-containing protein [Acetobacteraceae bacterium]|jgi:uncharacterized protein (DUF2252 family)
MHAMPLEHVLPDAVRPIAERRQAGQALRKVVPRSLHGTWKPPANRRDPVQLLIDGNRHLLSHLLPLRYGRMRASPFAFLRGSAAIMAADLAQTPSTGVRVQSCGDCHLANFGTFASPDGAPVFDVNDFDETLPAPFEWDLKRLAASFAVAGAARNLPERTCRQLARSTVYAYRAHMATLSRMPPHDAWRSRIDVTQVLDGIEDPRLRERELKRLHDVTLASHRGYPKLIERHKGGWRIHLRPPLIFPLMGLADDTHEQAARTAFESYKISLPEERRMLVDRYKLADLAFKVVGIGSVGSFCAIALLVTPDDATLLLQLKEARRSVLEPYAGRSMYDNHGKRVVVGQHLMQTESDIFLGWTEDRGDDQPCYVRQLKDGRMAMVGTELADQALAHHAVLCGTTLARAHARSGDAACLAGYMGSGSAFDTAISEFAMIYAEQVDRDWRLFLDAIKAGMIEVSGE